MGDIAWTDRTWNPVRGCSRVSEGCRNCYAERMAARNLPELRSPTTGKAFAQQTPSGPRWTGKVELIPSRLAEPLRWRKPQRVFVNSMSDLFHESLSNGDIAGVFGIMACASQHTFQVLTKRPARMRKWLYGMAAFDPRFQMSSSLNRQQVNYPRALQVPATWPLPNVWLGVSVEDQATADERIELLLQTPAAVRWISLEPQLGHVDLWPWLSGRGSFSIDWVVQGGESGPGARPFRVEWARAVREQCKAAGTPYFCKQLGADVRWNGIQGGDVGVWPAGTLKKDTQQGSFRVCLRDRKGGSMEQWPADLRVREFPEVSRA